MFLYAYLHGTFSFGSNCFRETWESSYMSYYLLIIIIVCDENAKFFFLFNLIFVGKSVWDISASTNLINKLVQMGQVEKDHLNGFYYIRMYRLSNFEQFIYYNLFGCVQFDYFIFFFGCVSACWNLPPKWSWMLCDFSQSKQSDFDKMHKWMVVCEKWEMFTTLFGIRDLMHVCIIPLYRFVWNTILLFFLFTLFKSI